MGQRDTPALHAFGQQLEFLQTIGQDQIETRTRELANELIEGLTSIDGVHLWTSDDPGLRAGVVTFRPGGLDAPRVLAALEEDGIVAAARGGSDRGGIRFSPHFYNTPGDIGRGIDAIRRYMTRGV